MGLSVVILLGMSLSGPAAWAHSGPGGSLPAVSLGSNPHVNFTGQLRLGETAALMTVPADQELIVTLVATSHVGNRYREDGSSMADGFELLVGGERALSAQAIGPSSNASIAQGKGRLRVPAGAALTLVYLRPGDPAAYYIEGHLVQAGSPYRSFNGPTPTGSYTSHPVFTAESDRDFVIRTAVLKSERSGSDECRLSVEGLGTIPGDLSVTYDGAQHHGWSAPMPLVTGQGNLVVPAGNQVSIEVSGLLCEYYIDGEYIMP
jgi:hypothetical protein